MPAQRQPVERCAGPDLAQLVEQRWIRRSRWSASSSSASGPRRRRLGPRRLADLDPGAAARTGCSSWPPGYTWTPGCRRPRRRDVVDHVPTWRGPVLASAPMTTSSPARSAPNDLVGMVEQPADPAAERRRAAPMSLRPTKRTGRSTASLIGERGEDRRQGEAAGVDHDQRAVAAREVLVAHRRSRSSAAATARSSGGRDRRSRPQSSTSARRLRRRGAAGAHRRATAIADRRRCAARWFIAGHHPPAGLADDARPAVELVDHLGRRRFGHDAEQLGHATVVGETPAVEHLGHVVGDRRAEQVAQRLAIGQSGPISGNGSRRPRRSACRHVIAPLATTLTGSARPPRAAATNARAASSILDHGERRIGEHAERHDRRCAATVRAGSARAGRARVPGEPRRRPRRRGRRRERRCARSRRPCARIPTSGRSVRSRRAGSGSLAPGRRSRCHCARDRLERRTLGGRADDRRGRLVGERAGRRSGGPGVGLPHRRCARGRAG